MTKLELKYNPFTHERAFFANGKKDDLPNCWGDDDSKELSEWCGDFFKAAKAKFNDSVMEVHFKGILRDWEFMSDACEKHCAENPGDKIDLVDDGCVNTKAKLGELRDLFDAMQREAPFPELKDTKLKNIFDKTMSSEFEMAVVATMSSGKSTLINSMLGCELLPARNEATTATLAKIHDVDGMDVFRGSSYDAQGNKLASCDPLTLDNMNALNDNPATSTIEIDGDVVGVESRDIKLVLTDTPGPNNSRTDEHKNHTYKLIKETDYKPMILYVLNGTQLETNDDSSLLRDVANAMLSGDRESRDRFLFVLNKADQFDPGKGESAQKKLEDVKRYLEEPKCGKNGEQGRPGIANPRVFPAAALMAKVIRQYLNGQPLTETEEDEILPTYTSFVRRDWKHFSDLAPLSPSARKELNEMLSDARWKGDKYREALIYTGIPAIELAISEYLAKYALPAKIVKGVRSFKSTIDKLKVEANAIKKLEEDEAEIEKLKTDLSKLSDVIGKGEKAKALRDKIDGFSSEKIIKDLFEKARAECQNPINMFIRQKSKNSVTKEDAESWIGELKEKVDGTRQRFKVDIENALNTTIRGQAEAAVKEYTAYLSALVGDVTHESPDAILGAAASISVEESLDAFTKNVVVDHKLVEQRGAWGSIKRGFGSIFNADWGYDSLPVYGDRVDFAAFLETTVLPKVQEFFIATRKMAFELAKGKEVEFKEFYKGKLLELDARLKEKIAEKEKKLSSRAEIERMIEENKKNLAWLKDFMKKLDDVLAI